MCRVASEVVRCACKVLLLLAQKCEVLDSEHHNLELNETHKATNEISRGSLDCYTRTFD